MFTRVVINNGFSPQWNNAECTFAVYLPELAILEIDVVDYDTIHDAIIANSYLPMDQIQQGYRNAPLFTKKGTLIPSASLLFKITIQDPNHDEYVNYS